MRVCVAATRVVIGEDEVEEVEEEREDGGSEEGHGGQRGEESHACEVAWGLVYCEGCAGG